MKAEINKAIELYIHNKWHLIEVGGRCIEKNIQAPYECYKEFGNKPAPTEHEIKKYNAWKKGFNSRKWKYAELFREAAQV